MHAEHMPALAHQHVMHAPSSQDQLQGTIVAAWATLPGSRSRRSSTLLEDLAPRLENLPPRPATQFKAVEAWQSTHAYADCQSTFSSPTQMQSAAAQPHIALKVAQPQICRRCARWYQLTPQPSNLTSFGPRSPRNSHPPYPCAHSPTFLQPTHVLQPHPIPGCSCALPKFESWWRTQAWRSVHLQR